MAVQQHTPALIRRVLQMWRDGKTGGDIAAAVNMTRGAVMGLIHRQRKNGEKGLIRVGERNKFPSKKEVERKQKQLILDLFKKPVPPPPEAITILGLTPDSCRYIVSEGDVWNTFYCGAPKERGTYCEEHAKICYVKVTGPTKQRKKRNVFVLRALR